MKLPSISFLLITLACLVAACKKKDDTQPPTIVISAPQVGNTYYYNDFINVSAQVTDDKNLVSVKVSVTNSSGQEFLQVINSMPNTTSKSISTSLYHNDLFLVSGTYYVTITANDGENEMQAFREINLVEAPRTLERVFVNQLYDNGTRLDSVGGNALVQLYFLPGIYSVGLIDSKYGNYIHTDNNTKTMYIFDMENQMNTIGNYNTPGTASGSFYNCIAQDPYTNTSFIGADDNRVYSISREGIFSVAIQFDNGFMPEYACIVDDYLYFFAKNSIGTQQKMSVYNRTTNVFVQSLTVDINFDVTGIACMDDNNVLVVGEQNGASLFKTYEASTNTMNTVFTNYHPDPCTGVWKDGSGNFYTAQNEKVVKYGSDLTMGSVSDVIPQLKLVRIENVSGAIYAVAPTKIHLLSSTTLAEYDNITTSNCLDVLFLYNK